MAPPAEIRIMEALPDILPEDFGEWDDEESPPAQALRLTGSQAGSRGKVAPRAAAPQKAAPPPRPQAAREAGRVRFYSLRPGNAERAEWKPTRKKWPVIAGGGAALLAILSAALIPALHRREAPAMNKVAAPELAKDVRETIATGAPKPQNAVPQSPLSALTVPAPDQDSAGSPQAQAGTTNDEQNAPAAPARIGMAAAPAQHAPPPSSSMAAAAVATAADGSDKNAAIGSISHGEKQSRLQLAPPRVVDLLAGTAFGLLIRRTPPVYPQVARELGIAGTVILQVHISKNGTVEDLRVVSGPKMLQQAAVDAVRTWRYRPYRMNNQPAEIETSVAVEFSLPG
jgi:periplasmic protein TonB